MKKYPKPKTNEVASILLAAGQSRRMGAFKPLLPFGNTTVVRSCIDYLRAGEVQNIVVVLGHGADQVENHLRDSELQFALNPDPESQMNASIACGIKLLADDSKAVLIALTDQPAIPPDVVRTLINAWESGNKLIIPEFQGRGGHPVLVDLAFRDELLSLDPDRGLRSFFDKHKNQVRRVSVSSPFIARDMDTWEDYRALHEEIFGILPGGPESSKAR